MVHRVASEWAPPEGKLFLTAFDVMASYWPRERRQDVYDYIANTIFPIRQTSKLWKDTDRTSDTRDNVTFHQLDVRIQDKPCVWFKNLKMLQIREALGLDCHIQVNHRAGKIVLGELIAKTEAISHVIGEAKAKQCKTPVFKRKGAVRDFPNIRAEGLRERGLRARAHRS